MKRWLARKLDIVIEAAITGTVITIMLWLLDANVTIAF